MTVKGNINLNINMRYLRIGWWWYWWRNLGYSEFRREFIAYSNLLIKCYNYLAAFPPLCLRELCNYVTSLSDHRSLWSVTQSYFFSILQFPLSMQHGLPETYKKKSFSLLLPFFLWSPESILLDVRLVLLALKLWSLTEFMLSKYSLTLHFVMIILKYPIKISTSKQTCWFWISQPTIYKCSFVSSFILKATTVPLIMCWASNAGGICVKPIDMPKSCKAMIG